MATLPSPERRSFDVSVEIVVVHLQDTPLKKRKINANEIYSLNSETTKRTTLI